MGEIAAELLFQQINDADGNYSHTEYIIKPEIIIRGSTVGLVK